MKARQHGLDLVLTEDHVAVRRMDPGSHEGAEQAGMADTKDSLQVECIDVLVRKNVVASPPSRNGDHT